MKKFIFLFILSFVANTTLLAYDAEIDGVYYNFSGDEAIVTFRVKNARDNYSGDVIIPEFVTFEGKEYRVTEIGRSAFSYSSELTSITIPASVIRIADWSFANCTGLTTIHIPESVTYIGDSAFRDCISLITVNIPTDVTSLNNYTFQSCYSLESIIIPEAVTNIGDDSFAGCKSLTSVIIPKNVTTIGTCAFLSCTGLTSITIPENVTTIGSRAFRGCTNLVSIDIPDGVNCIGNDAFYSTPWYDNQPDGLVYAGKVAYKYKGEMPEGTQIVIKEGTKGLSQNMFEICPGLSSIFIPKSVTYISDHIFDDLNNLISIVIEEGNCVYDSRDGCNAIIETATNTLVLGCQNTVIPDDVLQIGDFAFWLCRGLTSITIPEGVRSIGYASFYGCNGLESITIPNNVTSIDKKTFMNCRKLKSITLGSSLKNIKVEAFWECWPTFLACYAEIPPTCDIMTFAGTPEKCTLYVPKNSIDAYKSAEIWKKFVSIKDISEAETSINTTIAKENANSIYDLQGRKVNSQLRKKGIYIQNGKKCLDIRP